jgi:sec-independent protein translocase protein TatA
MLGNLTGWHFLIVLAVVLLLFGATKLPALAKSVGQSMRIFKGEMKTMEHDEPAPKVVPEAVPDVAPEPAATVTQLKH